MDDRRIEGLMELRHSRTHRRNDAQRKLDRGARLVYEGVEGLARYELGHHDELSTRFIAFNDSGRVGKPRAGALGFVELLIRRAHTKGKINALAHEGAERRPVRPFELHELRDGSRLTGNGGARAHARRRAQRTYHAIAIITRNSGEVSAEFVALSCAPRFGPRVAARWNVVRFDHGSIVPKEAALEYLRRR